MISGVRDRAADSALIVRAREALATGPLGAAALMERVCAIPGAPAQVAARLADALFLRHSDFVRDTDGRWRLAVARPVRVPNAPSDDDVALDSLRFAVVDVETTGTSSGGADRVTEIAVVHIDAGRVGDVYQALVNPERSIPPHIVALTRITWEMVQSAPRFAELADAVTERLRDRVFVAHNVNFDWRFVCTEVWRASALQLAGTRLCTVRLARALLPQLPRRSLDSVARYFGIDIDERHRAGGDAVATARVLLRLFDVASGQGIGTWGALTELLAARRARGRRRRLAMPHAVSIDSTL